MFKPPSLSRLSSTQPLRTLRLPPTRTLFTRRTPPTPTQRFRSYLVRTTLILGSGLFLIYASDSDSGVHRWVFQPIFLLLTKNDPEKAHRFAVDVLKSGWAPKAWSVDKKTKDEEEKLLGFELWGQHFSSPVGLAAGFDKQAEAIDGLFNLGFSYVEIGSVTPEPQPGNDKPRMFRLEETKSLINRYGFNSEGHLSILQRLKKRVRDYLEYSNIYLPTEASPINPESLSLPPNVPNSLQVGKVLGVNLGKNKVSHPNSIYDFIDGVRRLGPYADVLIINVSSPNTPGLRTLERSSASLERLVEAVVEERDKLKAKRKPRVLLKVSPDLDNQEVLGLAEVLEKGGVDGVIVGNTTVKRDVGWGEEPNLSEVGGLSGPPLLSLSLPLLRRLYTLTGGSVPIIACGGISTPEDALAYAKAGASFFQAYTAFGYEGVGWPRKMAEGLVKILKAEGKTWKEVVGSGIEKEEFERVKGEVKGKKNIGDDEQWDLDLKKVKRQLEWVSEWLEEMQPTPKEEAVTPAEEGPVVPGEEWAVVVEKEKEKEKEVKNDVMSKRLV